MYRLVLALLLGGILTNLFGCSNSSDQAKAVDPNVQKNEAEKLKKELESERATKPR